MSSVRQRIDHDGTDYHESGHHHHRTLIPGKEIGQYKLLKQIGKGGFGSIWLVKDKSSSQLLAMKAEKTRHHAKTLSCEKKCLRELQGDPYFPTYYEEAHLPHYDLMFMECLGPSLRKLKRQCTDSRFTLSTSLRIAIEMLRSIRALHEKGYIHRDIKPDNFVLRASKSAPIALIDYGLSRRYITEDGEMIPPRIKPGFVGTDKFASITAHNSEEQTRRDDIESWFYCLLQIMLGQVPWSQYRKRDDMKIVKETIDYHTFLAEYPPQIAECWDLIPPSGNTDAPPYDDLILAIQEAIENEGINWSDPYDWEGFDPQKLRRISSIDLTPPVNDQPNIPQIQLTKPRSCSLAVFNLKSSPLIPESPPVTPTKAVSPLIKPNEI